MKNLWNRLSKRERILALVSAAILLLIVAKFVAVNPLLARREWVKSQLESQPPLLIKNLRYLGQQESMRAALEAARSQVKTQEAKLLAGATPSVTASDLQETVQALATREGTQVITTRVLNPEQAESFSKIGIQMEIGGQIQQIANLIKGIEASPKLLVIDEINVRSLFRPAGFPQGQGIPQAPVQNLRVSLTVVGFARNQPAAPAKPVNPNSQTKGAGASGV